MQIKIVSENQIDNFVKVFIPNYIMSRFETNVNKFLLHRFDDMFDIDSYGALKFALRNLLITKEKTDTYIIKFDKSLKYDEYFIMDYVNLITYGTREIKGYPILLDIFKYVSNNISTLYTMWEVGM